MINTLHIKNVGIIDDVTINLNDGLNILTGETGAGKTLIIDSLQIISGGRFSKEMIRKGQEYSRVEAALYIDNEDIVVTREINQNGRNTCKINGSLVTVAELKNYMKNIIDIHGQHENVSLLDQTTHIKYIDTYADNEIIEIKEKYQENYKKYLNLKEEIDRNFGDDKEKQRELDLLRYQNKEIEDLELKQGEEEELETTRQKILNSEKIINSLEIACEQISGTSIDGISTSVRALEKISSIDLKYETTLNNLKSIYYDIQELSRDIENYKEEIYFDEEERNKLETRLDMIYMLKRKYGNSIEEILKYNEEIKERIEKIQNSEEYVKKLKQELKQTEEEMKKQGEKMHEIRGKHAQILEKKINQELNDLEMQNAKFSVKLDYKEEKKFGPNGLDETEFMISTNIGEDQKPLAKIASGGEMSRIMLAIKNILSDVDRGSTMVFDEIDTGISGKAANSVGEKLKSISKVHQILCVTHLANIAAKGDYNYYISKEVKEERTKTSIKKLTEQETISEIARIASGDVNEIAIEHAKTLRKIA